MRRRKSVEPRFFVGIAAAAVLCILSAVYSGVTGNPSPVSRAAGAVIRPVQRLASGIGGVFERLKGDKPLTAMRSIVEAEGGK